MHLKTCSTEKENLAQADDTPGCHETPSASVQGGYGRQQQVFCQRDITNITTYNGHKLMVKWRQQELLDLQKGKN